MTHTRRVLSFLLVILISSVTAPASDFKILNDCSASMDGERIESARQGAMLFCRMLKSGDSVQIIGFSDRARVGNLHRLGIAADRESLLKEIEALKATGGTNYLSALEAITETDNNDRLTVIFLSDGEHQGDSDAVIKRLNALKARCTVHTIAVGCQPDSKADKLLGQMATVTGGSHSRVVDSEELVERFVKIASMSGNYRRHTPSKSELTLRGVAGRAYVFGYDANVVMSPPLADVEKTRAILPGEDVTMTTAVLERGSSVTVHLKDQTTATSRLGDVVLEGMLEHQFQVVSKDDELPAGRSVDASFSFSGDDGMPLDLMGRSDVSARVELISTDGTVLETFPAQWSSDTTQFNATLRVPASGESVTVRGVSVVTVEGHDFAQTDEQTFRIDQSDRLVGNRDTINYRNDATTFEEIIRLTWERSGENLQTATVTWESDSSTGISCDNRLADGVLTLSFRAEQPGSFTGSIVVDAERDGRTSSLRIPCSLTILKSRAGLSIDAHRDVHLGQVFPGEIHSTYLSFPSLDDEGTPYQVQLSDLSNGAKTIAMSASTLKFSAGKDTPGEIRVSVEVPADATAGNYVGQVSVHSDDLPGKVWETSIDVDIAEPLSAEAMVLEVPAGEIADGRLLVRNQSSAPVEKISISIKPLTGLQHPDEVVISLVASEIDLRAQEERELKLKIAALPSATAGSEVQGAIVLTRSGNHQVQVPVTLKLTKAEERNVFLVTPEVIRIEAMASEISTFDLTVRPSIDHEGASTVEAELASLKHDDGTVVAITAVCEWSSQRLVAQKGQAKAKISLLPPATTGSYSGQIRVFNDRQQSVLVPVQIRVSKGAVR